MPRRKNSNTERFDGGLPQTTPTSNTTKKSGEAEPNKGYYIRNISDGCFPVTYYNEFGELVTKRLEPKQTLWTKRLTPTIKNLSLPTRRLVEVIEI